MLRYLSANARHLDPELASKVLDLCLDRVTIKALQEKLPDEDPVILRTAVFSLLHEGKLKGLDLADARLGIQTVVRSV